jgi:hypothetical protein
MLYRTYYGLDGIRRTLRLSHDLPYNVDWHINEQPCNARIWIDESGYPLQIPVRAWRAVEFIDRYEPQGSIMERTNNQLKEIEGELI